MGTSIRTVVDIGIVADTDIAADSSTDSSSCKTACTDTRRSCRTDSSRSHRNCSNSDLARFQCRNSSCTADTDIDKDYNNRSAQAPKTALRGTPNQGRYLLCTS